MGVNVVSFGGENLVDLRDATATPEVILKGYTAYGANGEKIVGTVQATKRIELQISLPKTGWDSDLQQDVAVEGMTREATVIVTGAEESQPEYDDCSVVCSGQGEYSLLFSCETLPTTGLVANVAFFV